MGIKNRKKLHETDLEKDIRYRGPLSYREFRIFGWVFLALSQVAWLLSLPPRFIETVPDSLITAQSIIVNISSLSLPFLLMANFALILDHKNGYKSSIVKYAVGSAIVFFADILICYRYIAAAFRPFSENIPDSISKMSDLMHAFAQNGYIAFNVFIDLLLCTLILYFLIARPKRYFTGNKLIIFRCFSAIPVSYELAAIVLKILAVRGTIVLPVFTFGLLPVKPPITFLVFVVLVVYLKNREKRFCRYGRTHEEYIKFLNTNRNSLHFSIFAACTMAIAAIIDAIIAAIIMYYTTKKVGAVNEETLLNLLSTSYAMGFGKSVSLLPMAPVMLLFSYTRERKNKMIDYFIPVMGILLIILVYLEALRYGFRFLPQLLEHVSF